MAKVKLGLRNRTPDELVAFANTIKTAMTGNGNFSTPNPTLAALGTLITTAQTKIAAYNSVKAALDAALADRDAALLALSGGLTQEAAYVENITGGDKVKIESSGMSVTRPQPISCAVYFKLCQTAAKRLRHTFVEEDFHA